MSEVVIVSAGRTPIGGFLGALSGVSAPRLGASTIQAVVERAGVKPDDIDEVIMGQVLSAGVGQAPARQASVFAKLPDHVRCLTVNKVCGSGLKSVALARQILLSHDADIIVAGGMESMSLAPYALPGGRSGMRLGHQQVRDLMVSDGLWDPFHDFHMGNAAEMCVKKYGFSRQAQDEYAVSSYKRAQEAIASGWFKKEIVPVTIPGRKGQETVVDTDEGPGQVQFEKIPKLKPVFEKDGTITAANASTINDGAAAVVLMRKDTAKQLGCPILATIKGETSFAQAPEWFTTAPIGAIRNVLKKTDCAVSDVDLWEINEAFSVVTMAAIQDLGLDGSKVNVHGGAVALGHPIGASGCRVLVTLIHAMERHDARRGVASLCLGGGEAIAMVIERS